MSFFSFPYVTRHMLITASFVEIYFQKFIVSFFRMAFHSNSTKFNGFSLPAYALKGVMQGQVCTALVCTALASCLSCIFNVHSADLILVVCIF